MRVLYFTYDLSDTTSAKRVRMLKAGGAQVTVAGFTRESAVHPVEECQTIALGRTYNARFVQRILAVLRHLLCPQTISVPASNADLILTRNLETLALAVRARASVRSKAPIVYESLDIHRLLLRHDFIGRTLRALEGWLCARASLLITSSPAFIREYFETQSAVKLPTLLIENKVLDTEGRLRPHPIIRPAGPPWRIGWFGAIRCRKSLEILRSVAEANPGLVEIIIRGRVSHDQFEDFDGTILRSPSLSFLGPYRNPEALADIYHDVHFSWAIDMFEEGKNSAWLLPNRIYEGSLFGAVPLAAEGVETAYFLRTLGIGHVLAEPKAESLTRFLKTLTVEDYTRMQHALQQVERARLVADQSDCLALIDRFQAVVTAAHAPRFAPVPEAPEEAPLLVVIPCLNESAYLESLINYLIKESRETPMEIVVADGGSTDGTVAIAQRLAEQYANVHYLHNPNRIQSVAVNLAVEQFGVNHRYLIRLDAHAGYPTGYCKALLSEARATNADSVVTSIHTIAQTPGFQAAVAAAQNSKLGNGGSSHRLMQDEGKYVDHGHHALMRLAAYRSVGGYDETFSHNEDAELDARLRKAGYRIWLTGKTIMDYYPRSRVWPLFRQYRGYGRGRARNLLRHRTKPKLRQMIPVVVAPAAALLLLAPWCWIAALPFLLWASICLSYGFWITRTIGDTHALRIAGIAAMVMHLAWSLGFWQGVVEYVLGRKR